MQRLHRACIDHAQHNAVTHLCRPGCSRRRVSQRPVAAPSLASLAEDAGPSTSASTTPHVVRDAAGHMVQGGRNTMEDEMSLTVNAKLGVTVAAVFDGHGGATAAEWLSQRLEAEVLSIVDQQFTGLSDQLEVTDERNNLYIPTPFAERVTKVFLKTDAALLKHLTATKGSVTGASGSTATVCLVNDQKIVTVSLGDSKAVLCRNGSPVELTRQHRLYGVGPDVKSELERVQATGAWVVDGRVCNILAVSRAFGDWEFKGEGLHQLLKEGAAKKVWGPEFAAGKKFTSDPVIAVPEVSETPLQPEDEFVLIATDGLWDYMPPADAVRWARKELKGGANAEEVAASLCDLAVKRYTTDNVAVVVLDLKGSDHWTARPKRTRGKSFLSTLLKN